MGGGDWRERISGKYQKRFIDARRRKMGRPKIGCMYLFLKWNYRSVPLVLLEPGHDKIVLFVVIGDPFKKTVDNRHLFIGPHERKSFR